MNRISTKPDSKYPLWVRFLLFLQRRKYGMTLESSKTWALSPALFRGVAVLYGGLDRKSSPIDPVLRALITVQISQINDCSFCVDINSALVFERGGGKEKLDQLQEFEESDLYTEDEKVALLYSKAVTLSTLSVTDEIWSNLLKYYSEDQALELTGLIAFQNLSSKFNAALEIAPQGFCKVPVTTTGSNSKET